MKYADLLILVLVSFVASKLLLTLISPNDPEGTNLLITALVAAAIFVPLLSAYRLASKKYKAKS